MITDKIESKPCWGDGAELILHVKDAKQVQSFMNKYNPDKDYEVKIEPKRKNRSLDANAYAWVLCRKISEKLGAYTDEDVYKECIRKYGVADIRPVREDAVKTLCKMWEKGRIGNQYVVLGDSKIKGYINVKFYWGSSDYNTESMARFIDGIVEDCHELGIETMTPDEVERLKKMWV